MSTSVYQRPFGAMAVYYGISETNTQMPQILGASNNALSFLTGRDAFYLSPTLSTLQVRGLRAYSNIKVSTQFSQRLTNLPSVIAVGITGPRFSVFPSASVANPSPWTGLVT